jgi:hypothetical protein
VKPALVAKALPPAPVLMPLAAISTPVALKVAAVTASSNDGHLPQNTLDSKLSTRWSANGLGQSITYDLGTAQTVASVKIAFYEGSERTAKFNILTSTDSTTWTHVYSGQSSGKTNSLQSFNFTPVTARFVRIVGEGNTVNAWISLTEVSIYGNPAPAPAPAAATTLGVSGLPASLAAGAAATITITAKDANGNTVPGYLGTVSFTSSDSAAVLPASYTFTAADKGVHTFKVTLNTAGTASVIASDGTLSGSASTQVTSAPAPAVATTFAVSGLPSSVTAGTAESITITAKDANGNTVPGYLGTVSFTSTDSAAVLPASYTFTAADHGMHTFTVTLKTAGAATVTASDGTVKGAATTQVTSTVVNPGSIDLSHWYLTLPTGSQGSPTLISTSSLVGGYSSQYFYKGADGALVFYCPTNGVHTVSSTYPRSELRETNPDGSNDNWNVTAGTATLSATLAVNQVPPSGSIVVGQIHDDGANGIQNHPLFLLYYNYNSSTGTGDLVAAVRPNATASGTNKYTVATGIPLNTKFSYSVQLDAKGLLTLQINGAPASQVTQTIDPSFLTQGMYFKAGAYVIDNSGTGAGQVSFYALTTSHT